MPPPRSQPETKRTAPHQSASLRFLDAVSRYRVVTELVEQLQRESDAEYEAALAELRRYQNPDGTPLPEDEQWEIHKAWARAVRK